MTSKLHGVFHLQRPAFNLNFFSLSVSTIIKIVLKLNQNHSSKGERPLFAILQLSSWMKIVGDEINTFTFQF